MSNTCQDLSDHSNRIFGILTYCIHTSFLSYFMVTLTKDTRWYAWITVDVLILGLMFYSFIVTYNRKRTKEGAVDRLLERNYPGQLPYAVWIWFLVALSSTIRIGIIFNTYSSSMTESNILHIGPNFLQLTIGLLSPLFYFTVKSVRLTTRQNGSQFIFEEYFLVLIEMVNFLDATDILMHFYGTTSVQISSALKVASLVFALLTFFLPLISLGRYTLIRYTSLEPGKLQLIGEFDAATGLDVFYCIAGVFLMNIPLGILRVVLWRTYAMIMSTEFLIKNFMFVYILCIKIGKLFVGKRSSHAGKQFQTHS